MYQLIRSSQKLLLVYYFVILKKNIKRRCCWIDENCPLVISSLNAKNAISLTVCQLRICVTTLNNNERGNCDQCNGRIIEYIVIISNNSNTYNLTSTERYITVNDLVLGGIYSISLAAMNSIGIGLFKELQIVTCMTLFIYHNTVKLISIVTDSSSDRSGYYCWIKYCC